MNRDDAKLALELVLARNSQAAMQVPCYGKEITDKAAELAQRWLEDVGYAEGEKVSQEGAELKRMVAVMTAASVVLGTMIGRCKNQDQMNEMFLAVGELVKTYALNVNYFLAEVCEEGEEGK